ncbi:murein transglycosylase domain-containing protein [Thiomicrorhabdus sp. ZW0627]|uniref:murein transglycosylase domain-containing protein n=1 Tax=Thiomicrorhabdus sp. ZW0627 TaxID=3039774 RepID=UPI0024365719|nr:murein transglycosylase domain-containing protein [Thiomicrorhabdus sp. ZW0627]MDG6773367.1 murein transglycosylase domain-containing protein [Thiomicrorhabdus sp. ZW0627]
MKITTSIYAALVASFVLLVVAGNAFSGFADWMRQHRAVVNSQVNQPLVSSGMRMVSTNAVVVKPHREVVDPSVKKPSSDISAVVIPVATMPSRLPQDMISESKQTPMDAKRTVESQKQVVASSMEEPTVVVYDDELLVEFPHSVSNKRDIKRAISRLLLSDRPFAEDLLSNKALSFKEIPYFYKKVLDQNHRAIRYPADAFEYADYLLDSERVGKIEDEEGPFVVVSIPLVDPNYPDQFFQYRDWVTDYAKQFDVSPALVFAIMETESDFQPKAVSRSNALGLMQLKPQAAGKDVYQYVDMRKGQPSRKDLFDAKNNIRMGTAYLGLLAHDYLDQVKDKDNKELLVIASYNGGLSTVLKLFGDTEEQAVEHINRLHPRQVYRKLRFEHQSDETRRYLDKVMKAKNKYRAIFEV